MGGLRWVPHVRTRARASFLILNKLHIEVSRIPETPTHPKWEVRGIFSVTYTQIKKHNGAA